MPSFMTLRLQTQNIRGNRQTDRQIDRQTDRPTIRFISIDRFQFWRFTEEKTINNLCCSDSNEKDILPAGQVINKMSI